MGTGFFPGDKAAGTWSCTLTSHLVQSLRSTGAIPPHHLYGIMACTGTTPTSPLFLPTVMWMMPNNQHTIGESFSFHHFHLVTGWTVRGSNPGEGEAFRTRPGRPWGPPSLVYNGYRVSFPRVKRPGRGVDHPPPSSAEVKEIIQLYVYSPSGPPWPVLGWTLPFTLQEETMMYNC
jgi:hypothetical protein